MTDDEWKILEPFVEACKRSSTVLQMADQLTVPSDERAKMEQWLTVRKMQKSHDSDIAELERMLGALKLV